MLRHRRAKGASVAAKNPRKAGRRNRYRLLRCCLALRVDSVYLKKDSVPRLRLRCYQSKLEQTRCCEARARATTDVARPRGDWAARSCARATAA
eukprot:5129536-Pleurochrysis_carterae.AAC.1